jgi:oligopeptide transport system substrate-binding protein
VRETYFKIALTHHLAFDFEKADEAWKRAAASPGAMRAVDLEPTERVQTAVWRPASVVPGFSYSNTGWWISEQLFRGLFRVDRELNIVLDVARECGVSPDGCVYRFRLRPDARWSDGVPVSADDFVFAWQQGRELQLRAATALRDIENARALADGTLEVRLEGPRGYFPYVLASSPSFPWPRHRCEELGDAWMRPEHLIGNGPFELAGFDDEHILLRARRDWPRTRGNVREAHVDLSRKFGSDDEYWRSGQFDFMFFGQSLQQEETVVETLPLLSTLYVGFRSAGPPFADERVRKAFAHATDGKRVAQLGGEDTESSALGGLIPPAMPGHSHRVGLEEDLELAGRLLAEAGYPQGRGLPQLTIFALAETWGLAAAEEVARQWSRLGLAVGTKAVAFHDLEEAVFGGAAAAWLWAWIADLPDPHGMLDSFLETTPVYRDAEILDCLTRARSVPDQDERMRLYRDAERLLIAERAAFVPVAYLREAVVRQPWIEGLWATPLSKASLDEVLVRRPT